MSQTAAEELLEATRAFLRHQVLPQLEGFDAYTTRVAANSLAIVARELRLGPELERIDRAMASALAMDPAAGPIPRQIALGLRDGVLQPDAALLEYLKQRTMTLLAIDNPKYSGYLQACERWQAAKNTGNDLS